MKYPRVIFVSLFLLPSVFFITSQPTFAAVKSPDECTCFCTSKNGVIAVNEKGNEITGAALFSQKTYPPQCETACKGKKPAEKMVACATSAEYFPSNNKLCFTPEQCGLMSKDEKGVSQAKWDGPNPDKQPPECMHGMFYCYPDVKKAEANLSVKIGGVSKISDLGQYVNILYQWMLGVAGVIAIVMIMIGGLQWVLSPAVGDIKKAQDRIQNGIIGLILLFCIVLILKVVNPQLLTITVPKLPLIRTLEIAGGKTCKQFEAEGYTVVPENKDHKSGEPDEKLCGNMGLVTTGKTGKEVVSGTTCQYVECNSGNETLPYNDKFCVGFGEKAQCLRCGEVTDGNTSLMSTGVEASPEICAQMAGGQYETTSGKPFIKRCVFTKDGNFTVGWGANKLDVVGSCVYMNIDCNNIHTCEDYAEKVYTTNEATKDTTLVKLDTEPDESKQCLITPPRTCSNASFATVCQEDPCKVGTDGHRCRYHYFTGLHSDECHNDGI